ncbi:hypothetical protein GW17_00024262, partial [Ensete ventricosum]
MASFVSPSPPPTHSPLSFRVRSTPSPSLFPLHSLPLGPRLRSAALRPHAKIRAGPPRAAADVPKAGVAVYKPRSYEVLVSDAARSLVCAVDDGKTRLEIDFPYNDYVVDRSFFSNTFFVSSCSINRPLPSNISSYKGNSDEFIDANIQLALAVARKLQEMKGARSCIHPRAVVAHGSRALFLPRGEKDRGDVVDGPRAVLTRALLPPVGHQRPRTVTAHGSRALFLPRGEKDRGDASITRSFPQVGGREEVQRKEGSRNNSKAEKGRYKAGRGNRATSACWLHYVVICAGPWQVMLKQVDGSYACVAESATRFTLGEAKEELLRVLGLQEEQGSSLEFLRRGYK